MGLCLALPMGYFWYKGTIPSASKPKMLGLLGLFGFQGVLGWWMVKSGLQNKDYENRVSVAPTRLAVHLGFGSLLYSLIFYTGLNFFRKTPEDLLNTKIKLESALKMRKGLIGLLHLTFTTLIAGALVAGSDAGRVLNNFPFYGEDWVFPRDALDKQPWYRNFVENRSMIQFVHRNIGYITYGMSWVVWLKARNLTLIPSVRFGVHGILVLSNLQALLGITTLMRGCPLPESLSHQSNALLLISMILFTLSGVRKPPKAIMDKLLK